MPEKVNRFCDECNSVWNMNLDGLEMSTSVPVMDLSSDSEPIDLTVPLPPRCFYIRDFKTGLPCVCNHRENYGWTPDDSEIISSPTRPIRSRIHRPVSPVIHEPAIEVPVHVDEAPTPVDRALSPPPKDIRLMYTQKKKRGVQGEQPQQPVLGAIAGCVRDVLARPIGEGIVLGERSVYEIEDDVSDAHYGRFLTLDEERLLEEDAMNKMHFRINDLEVVGVTTGHRLQALEDRAGVSEVGLLVVQQKMSGMAVNLDLTQAYSCMRVDVILVDVVRHKLPMAPTTRTGGSSGSTPLPSSSEELAQVIAQHVVAAIAQQNANRNASGKKVVETGEKFGDVEKNPFDGKRKNSGFPKNRSAFKKKRNQNSGNAYAANVSGSSGGKIVCERCGKQGHQAPVCRSKTPMNFNTGNYGNANRCGCYECGAKGHFKKDCPKLKPVNARARVFEMNV
ncbi:hypothetical protein L1987_45743 [Smallanthus sonchifolius]|uniref:Uncharacterized protein n=1 Tax=Smallanthus sonchifolius TaxID=185202 RepID=A0ACB9FYU9_9ASTR|nr:hypothetical protein L1987_45743 [Smallanthus sonchifolius]